jgi:hypothetical protein
MHGPTCIFWANLTPLSLKARTGGFVAIIIFLAGWFLQANMNEPTTLYTDKLLLCLCHPVATVIIISSPPCHQHYRIISPSHHHHRLIIISSCHRAIRSPRCPTASTSSCSWRRCAPHVSLLSRKRNVFARRAPSNADLVARPRAAATEQPFPTVN